MIKVCHVTSVHPVEDIRIFRKECVSLVKAGYDVTLVQQGTSYEKDGIHIVGFGSIAQSRLERMTKTAQRAYQAALAVDADIYHLHDPELLPYARKLKKKGKTVIFDSHEDVPADISEKYWIPAPLRRMIAWAYGKYEKSSFRKLDGVIGVTPSLCERICCMAAHSEMITNYPIWEELAEPAFSSRKLAFPGLVSRLWNIHTILEAIEDLDGVTLELRSRNVEEPYGTELRAMPGWEKVNFPGPVPHAEVLRLLSESVCGMALCAYCPNTAWKRGTLGNTKIFEYMMAGIPVICTNFDLWREIVEEYHCGICVEPDNVRQVGDAIRYLLEHPDEARQMGENGRRAVKERFNWGTEERKLLAFYQKIC